MINEIIADGGISDTHLRMLVERIVIQETPDGLSISINMKARFATHIDTYDNNGNVTNKMFSIMVGGLHTENELAEMLGYVHNVQELYLVVCFCKLPSVKQSGNIKTK